MISMIWNSMAGRQKLEVHGKHMNDDKINAEVESKVLTVLKKINENISHEVTDVIHRLSKSKNKTHPPTSLSDLSLEKTETICVKKGRN